jgi:hypothetical protein
MQGGNMKEHTEFDLADIQSMNVDMKVGILGTVTPEGLPHLTMISTLQPFTPTSVVWGQFTEGHSKEHVRQNPKTGFLIMTLQRELWRGKALFTHTATGGSEYAHYNNIPMFRYNAYFGIHTVYYMHLVATRGREQLPMGKIVWGAVQSMLARGLALKRNRPEILSPWTIALLNKLDNLKFLCYIDVDGHPLIIPVIQAQAANSQQVIFSLGAYADELRAIPAGIPLALFGMSFDMEDVLLRGVYQGIRRVAGIPCGILDVDWVYNPMPPIPGQVYPPVELQTVTEY